MTPLYQDLVPLLRERGAEVVIVVSRGEHRAGRSPEGLFRDHPGVRVVRTVNFGFHAHQGKLQKLVVAAAYLVQATLHGLFGPRVDENIFLTQPPFVPLIGTLLRTLRRQPYYILLMDLQPQLAISVGLLNEKRPWTKFLLWATQLGLRRAKGVIVIGRCMAEVVESLGVERLKIHFIPNWADERSIIPIQPAENKLRRREGWDDKFIVCYAGNIGVSECFEDLLEVAGRLENQQKLLFVIVGGGMRRRWLEREVQRRRLRNVRLLPFFEDERELSHVLSAGDLHHVSRTDACTGLSVPSKTYGILAAGRPLIFQGSQRSEIARLIIEEGIGEVVACGDTDGLEQALLRFLKSDTLRAEAGLKSRHLAEGKYSRTRALKAYLDLLLAKGRGDARG